MVADLKTISAKIHDNVLNESFWRDFAPNFSITNDNDTTAFNIKEEDKAAYQKKFEKEAYLHLKAPGLNAPFAEINDLFQNMVNMGTPTVFAFVYDEFWDIRSQLKNLVSHTFDEHDFMQLPDFWGWHVSPGQSGWAPHRDKHPSCLFLNKKPKSVTVWLPLNQATPINGCMYILPADLDTGYGTPMPNGRNTPPKLKLPDARALPCDAGDVLVWTQQAYHWGSRSADDHDLPPRMSIAFEFQRKDIEPLNSPLIDVDYLPTFEERLALIAKQVQQYKHMYKFNDELINLAKKIEEACELPKSI